MALEAKLSTTITNLEAQPIVKSKSNIMGGVLREAIETVSIGAADNILSTYRFVRLASNARISTLEIASDDLGTTGLLDVGIMNSDGTVVDINYFASAVDVKAAAIPFTDVTQEATAGNFDLQAYEMWQHAGASTDPGGFYDLMISLNEATTATGNVSMRVRYTNNT